ncbi:GspE/PulE family protein [Kiritimatiella glycovorans]|uniref:Type II secretion system protein E n=1 Tax=Kiritimatiella glycovorans TaxID=1307763 RepID=A0A0G3EJG4_9BACT|nr:GspE/PulE family protein [Kiritimatiella glycovorans]AKJ64925.1 Type II secretion system protein E [Kiritimatiella glycovorans]
MSKRSTSSSAGPSARSDLQERLGEALVRRGTISEARLKEYRDRAAWLKQPLDRQILRDGVLAESELLEILSELTGIPVLASADHEIPPEIVDQVPPKAVVNFRVMPVSLERGVLVLATDRVRSAAEEEHLRVLLGYSLRWVFCTSEELSEFIKHYYGVGIATYLRMEGGSGRRSRSDAEGDMPALVREILHDAIRCGATDLHLEPEEDGFRLRYRIDGVLYTVPTPRGLNKHARALMSSVKVMAQLNIAEKRLPQDGRFSFDLDDQNIDVRVSVLPATEGETVNLRILNRQSRFINLDELGLSERQRSWVDDMLAQPHGVILFTGPTGSGKTTSLYAALDHLNNNERKIITLEDPVEYRIPGISQLQVNGGIGFTFASGLRSILRHDPDVVLIGEIRDTETAEIAVSAALTGHLVFSTLHTNDTGGAVTRMIEMGIEPYLVASGLQGVIAQRLVRSLCPRCAVECELPAGVKQDLRESGLEGIDDANCRQAPGCPYCRFTGYRGRRAVFEIMVLTDDLRSLISRRLSSGEIMERAIEQGMITLWNSAWELVRRGETSLDEMLRVTKPLHKKGY